MNRLALALVLLVPAALPAAAQGLEVTPMFGYRWGGTLSDETNDLFDQDVDIESSTSYGLHVGIPLGAHSQIELIGSRQSSKFGDALLFGGASGVDVDVTYYHVGYQYQWITGNRGNLRPYVAASLGVTNLDPDVQGASSDDRFSMSLGGGLKVMATEHIGFRLDGRLYWTDTGDHEHVDWDECDDDCWEWDSLVQQEVKVGVVFVF
jgi:hypothetical protein